MNEYLKTTAPTSNEESGVYYEITHKARPAAEMWPERTETLYTVDAVENAVTQIKAADGDIISACRVEVSAEGFKKIDFIPETRAERNARENREYCKRIAKDLEKYVNGEMYRCPECGDVCEIEETENDDGDTIYKTSCGCVLEYEPEQLGLYDYFADCLDIEYRCNSSKEYRSVSVMVTCGGPNIYIDTDEKAVLLYWWSDRARYYISDDAARAIDDWAEEYWNCL